MRDLWIDGRKQDGLIYIYAVGMLLFFLNDLETFRLLQQTKRLLPSPLCVHRPTCSHTDYKYSVPCKPDCCGSIHSTFGCICYSCKHTQLRPLSSFFSAEMHQAASRVSFQPHTSVHQSGLFQCLDIQHMCTLKDHKSSQPENKCNRA